MRAIARHRLLAVLASFALLTVACEADTAPPEDPEVIEDPDATDPSPQGEEETVGDEAVEDGEGGADADG